MKPLPQIHPQVLTVVLRLIAEGRAGDKPFGLPQAMYLAVAAERGILLSTK